MDTTNKENPFRYFREQGYYLESNWKGLSLSIISLIGIAIAAIPAFILFVSFIP